MNIIIGNFNYCKTVLVLAYQVLVLVQVLAC